MDYFLTDARTHRGTSGARVVMRLSERESNTMIYRGNCSGFTRLVSTLDRAIGISTRRLA